MGYGSYKANDWQKLKQSKGINANSKVNELFGKTINEKYLPKYFETRESLDSEDSPNSTPIIIAFDDTASMGYLAEEIASNSLNKTILEIYDKKPVTNPHICCATFGNNTDRVPLQVTQFEADIRIAEQLLDFYIEQGGNCYSGDAYVWYFAAKHTKTDSFEKRRKKGFLFTIGDDFCKNFSDNDVQAEEIQAIFGDKINTKRITPKAAYKMASRQYNVFHIIVKPVYQKSLIVEKWNSVAPGHIALIENANDVKYLAEVIISIMQVTNGMKKKDAIAQWGKDSEAGRIVANALSTIK